MKFFSFFLNDLPCRLGLDTAGSLALRDRNEMTAALAEYRSISVLDKSRL